MQKLTEIQFHFSINHTTLAKRIINTKLRILKKIQKELLKVFEEVPEKMAKIKYTLGESAKNI